MYMPKFLKIIILVLACILCVCILFHACVNALLQVVVPDNPGNRDWRYVLQNGYEISHLSSNHIVLVNEEWSAHTNIVVDTHIVAFCSNDRYIGLKCTDPQAAEGGNFFYFLVNTVENQLLGPFTELEYQETCTANGIADFSEWIATSPPPDGATYR